MTKENAINKFNIKLKWYKADQENPLLGCIKDDFESVIKEVYNDFRNIINIEIDKLNNKIHKGFCDDKTQDKNYEIFDKISILENIKKNLNAD